MSTVLSNEPKSWVEHHVDGVMVPASIGHEIEFDQLKDRYRNKQELFDDPTRTFDVNKSRSEQERAKIYVQASAEKSRLLGVMNGFRINMEKSTGVHFDETRFQTWNDVMQLMDSAKETYEKKSGSTGIQAIKKFFAKLGDRGATFNAWLNLLPNGEYSSVICGAFKLVIEAGVQAKAHRDSIFEVLGSIPATLTVAKQYIGMWADPLVDSAFSRLCIAVLQFFTYTLKWLSKPSLYKVMKAMVKQDQYGQESQALVCAIREEAEGIHRQAEICSQRVTRIINVKVDQSKLLVVQHSTAGISSDVDSLKDSMADVQRMLAAFSGNIPANIMNAIYKMIQGRKRDHEILTSKMPAVGTEVSKEAAKRLTPGRLQKIIDHDPQLEDRAVNSSWSEGATFTLQDQERVEGLLSSKPFQDWFNSRNSRLLLVNCEAEPGRISPASVAWALLAKSLAENGAITLSFFCGLYDDPRNEDTGTKQMLVDLVGQLLDKYQAFDLSFLEPSQRRALERHEAELLCDVLIMLLKQLPRESFVFLLLDGISFYEIPKLGDDLLAFVSALKDLVEEDEDLEAVVKVVFTSPSASQRVSRMLNRGQVFSLEDGIELTNQGINPTTYHRLTMSPHLEQSRRCREATWCSSSDQGSTESEDSDDD